MNSAPLSLRDYWVVQLSIRDVAVAGSGSPKKPARSPQAAPTINWTVYRSEERDAYLVRLTARFARGAPSALKGLIEVAGLFTVENDVEHAAALLNMNAPSILFGIARGVVGSVSASTVGGKYVLPAVNFVELAARKQPATRSSRAKRRGPAPTKRSEARRR